MTAEEFYKKEKNIGTYEQNFSGLDMIKFAEKYAEQLRLHSVSESTEQAIISEAYHEGYEDARKKYYR